MLFAITRNRTPSIPIHSLSLHLIDISIKNIKYIGFLYFLFCFTFLYKCFLWERFPALLYVATSCMFTTLFYYNTISFQPLDEKQRNEPESAVDNLPFKVAINLSILFLVLCVVFRFFFCLISVC